MLIMIYTKKKCLELIFYVLHRKEWLQPRMRHDSPREQLWRHAVSPHILAKCIKFFSHFWLKTSVHFALRIQGIFFSSVIVNINQ